MLPQSKPDKEWLVNAIKVFFGDQHPASLSIGLADHILGNWIMVERNEAMAEQEKVMALVDALLETTAFLNWSLGTSIHEQQQAIRGTKGDELIGAWKEMRIRAEAALALWRA